MPKKAAVKKTARSKKRGSTRPAKVRGGKKPRRPAASEKPAGAKTAATGSQGQMPADVDSIRQLVDLMVENDLNEIDIAHGQTKIVLRRGEVVPSAGPSAAVTAPQDPAEAPAEQELVQIKSPMVGTFFIAASPDSEPYVTVGAGVSEDTVVCIVEAMKVMNEIKAECTGTIAEVCVKNAQPVEFGQILFKVNPA